ncbi:MAG: thioredoxin domain-containing protein [Deltaproteobacteria bacterium]|nr:thioredoxin domain-containing protein [Deltaproteobacteria bacterium]
MAERAHKQNRLINEKSPYLRQHAENPVDWYPWSDEAIERARREDKPMLVSIGYSSCHWCHVMERESFEDADTARIMNENFINIKVDREERPDIDSLYMKAVQAMTGSGGWPLNVFTTPDGVPFFGGTYFPPDENYGMAPFKKVLLAASEAYRKNKARIDAVGKDITEALAHRKITEPVAISRGLADAAFEAARRRFDNLYGGFGSGAKFPHAMFLKFLYMYYKRTGEQEALAIVKKSLSAMASGGMYDHLGGGFHRYSVDERWEVPHFEKMLYDNALLLELCAFAHRGTGLEFFKETALETADYLFREMRDPSGGFYSSQDADVEGEEGGCYLWDAAEIRAVLSEAGAKRFMRFFSVTEEGNLEGKNVLRIDNFFKRPGEPLPEDIKNMKKVLLEARLKRRRPNTDKKIIAAWNGLVISALAEAGRAFGRKDLLDAAEKCARFILGSLRDEEGRLFRYHLGGKAGAAGGLEDYALTGCALLSLHDATGEEIWLKESLGLARTMTDLFYDSGEALFFDCASDRKGLNPFKGLFVRERDLFDNDVPSGNSAAAELFLRLSVLAGNNAYRAMSEEILKSVEGINEEPIMYGNFLCVLERFLSVRELPVRS